MQIDLASERDHGRSAGGQLGGDFRRDGRGAGQAAGQGEDRLAAGQAMGQGGRTAWRPAVGLAIGRQRQIAPDVPVWADRLELQQAPHFHLANPLAGEV